MDFSREHENDFSFWFPKVKDCGIKVPRTFYAKIPSRDEAPILAKELYQAFYMDNPEKDILVIQDWIRDYIIPELKKENLMGIVFVKNGRFSNKFYAEGNCILHGVSTNSLAEAIANINYGAMCVGADGENEIVVRQFIDYNKGITPCIYHGLPLRSEFRVFYDFDAQKSLFTVNYWDFNYVFPELYEATDKIVFEHEALRLDTVFQERKDEVQALVAEAMKNVHGLNGRWSIDILLDERGAFWLIDMAIAERSAYWDQRDKYMDGEAR